MAQPDIGNCKIYTKRFGGVSQQHEFTIPLEYLDREETHGGRPAGTRRKVTVLGCICGAERSRATSA